MPTIARWNVTHASGRKALSAGGSIRTTLIWPQPSEEPDGDAQLDKQPDQQDAESRLGRRPCRHMDGMGRDEHEAVSCGPDRGDEVHHLIDTIGGGRERCVTRWCGIMRTIHSNGRPLTARWLALRPALEPEAGRQPNPRRIQPVTLEDRTARSSHVAAFSPPSVRLPTARRVRDREVGGLAKTCVPGLEGAFRPPSVFEWLGTTRLPRFLQVERLP